MSRYENYSIKNNVHGSLYAPISSLATTIQLKDGEGARFSTNMLATLESVDTTGKVTKREIVLITGISGDVLTVTRKYAPCPASDDGNTQGQVSFSFDADDTINAYITKEHFDKIDNSINDIYENGVDKLRTDVVSGLEISVSAGPVLVGSAYYDFAGDTITLTNNATNYVEISENGELVANTTGWGDKNTKISKVVTSGGAVTSIEDWRLGTVGGELSKVNIHDLTEKQTLSPDDEFIVSDSDNIYNNKKVKYSNAIKINSLTEKSATADNDIILIGDSENSFAGKKTKVQTIKNEIIYGNDLLCRTPMPIVIDTQNVLGANTNTFYDGISPYFYLWNNSNGNMYRMSHLANGYSYQTIQVTTITGTTTAYNTGYCKGICVYKGYVYICVYYYNDRAGAYNLSFYKQPIDGNRTTASGWTHLYTTTGDYSSSSYKFLGYDGEYFFISNNSTNKLYYLNTGGGISNRTIPSASRYHMNEKGNIVLGIDKDNSHYIQVYDNYIDFNLINEWRISTSSTPWTQIWTAVKGEIIYLSRTIGSTYLEILLPTFIINNL